MNLRDLEYITAVAKTGHFGKASEMCHVSQPTLSTQIKKLEEYLGIAIFERDNKNVMVTPHGQQLIKKAQIIVDEAKNLRDMAHNMQSPDSGRFTLGAFPTLAPFIFPLTVPHLKDEYPNMQLFLTEEKTATLLENLKTGIIDMALLAMPIEEQNFHSIELFQEPFYLAMPTKHPLANEKHIPLKTLAHEDLLLLEDGHCLSGQTMEVCSWIGAQKFNTFRATSIETLRQMVAAGLGVTLVPKLAVPRTAQEDIIYRPLENTPQPCRTIGLYWRNTSPFHETFEKIAEHIKSSVSKRLQD